MVVGKFSEEAIDATAVVQPANRGLPESARTLGVVPTVALGTKLDAW